MDKNFYKTKVWRSKRKKILRRDNYECQECRRYGKSRPATTVHHCNPLETHPQWRLESWNLLSLCSACHDKMHDRNKDVLTTLGEYWREKVTKVSPPFQNTSMRHRETDEGDIFQ
ncbi:HNH endonuclease [Lysinibacillus capsici]|uniref:HNH endonuclease n=1 Tax=Lysinibacillus capsici TaxID=2115968 RepID=UPI000E1FF16A|nr:HNH endonuclease [Lysinibacillus capsici]RDV26279.1 restriction endonuclease [Lysinibacillus capsici]